MGPKRHRIAPRQRDRARQLRRDATFPERLLWSRLRAGRLGGAKFRRQHPIGPYVVDFYCAHADLAIELDGQSHADRAPQDRQRTLYLQNRGLRVVRYTNDQVLQNVDVVAQDIARRVGVGEATGR